MATKQTTLVHVDEDYIHMELSSSSSSNNFFSYSIGSPPQNREFEFQMNPISNEKESTTFPADDLFYKGKLLPLHLPPRLQMVQNLLENSNATFDYVKSMPPTNASTPLESCNISPSESCRVSSEVNPDEYLLGWSSSSDMNGTFVGDVTKKSWPKKLKQIKQCLLGQKIKASRAYLKSLFSKSGCSNKSCASAANNVGEEKKLSKCKTPFEIFDDNVNKHQISYAVMKIINKEMLLEDDFSNHRKSFSGVVQRHCSKKSSYLSASSSGSSSTSSSFSFSSASYYDLQLFKRSISANCELENSIEGAIAHCKQSQKQCSSKNASDDRRICSQFASKVAVCGNQEMATRATTRG